MARTAVEGQHYDGQVEPDWPSNLWTLIEGDFGARGSFSDRARSDSRQLFLATDR